MRGGGGGGVGHGWLYSIRFLNGKFGNCTPHLTFQKSTILTFMTAYLGLGSAVIRASAFQSFTNEIR